MSSDFIYDQPDPELVLHAVDTLQAKLLHHGISIFVCGIDGSGKTTLVRTLVEVFRDYGITVRRFHWYQWYVNIAITPFFIFYNRYIGHKLIIFDRVIYDNIAVMSVKRFFPRWMANAAFAVTRACYPRFQYVFYLVTDLAETMRRRPDTGERQFVRLTSTYEKMMAGVRHTRLPSNPGSFCVVLRSIVAGASRDVP